MCLFVEVGYCIVCVFRIEGMCVFFVNVFLILNRMMFVGMKN